MPLPYLPPISLLGRALLAFLGLLSFIGGCAAVFITQNGPGTAAMITIGGAILVLSLVINSLDEFEVGGARFQFKLATVDAKLSRANELEHRGEQLAADSLRDEAEKLLEEAATEYLALRRSMRPGRERTAAFEDVLGRVKALTHKHSFDKDLANHWLTDRSEAHRIIALALMEGSPELRNLDSILDASANPRSAFEQYHALQLLEWMVRDRNDQVAPNVQRITAALRGNWSLQLRPDQSRYKIRNRILTELDRQIKSLAEGGHHT